MIGLFCKRAPFSVCKYEDMRFGHQIDRKKPLSPGGFPIFLGSLIKNLEEQDPPRISISSRGILFLRVPDQGT